MPPAPLHSCECIGSRRVHHSSHRFHRCVPDAVYRGGIAREVAPVHTRRSCPGTVRAADLLRFGLAVISRRASRHHGERVLQSARSGMRTYGSGGPARRQEQLGSVLRLRDLAPALDLAARALRRYSLRLRTPILSEPPTRESSQTRSGPQFGSRSCSPRVAVPRTPVRRSPPFS